MRFSSSRVALRAFNGERRLKAARSEHRGWASSQLALVRVADGEAKLAAPGDGRRVQRLKKTQHMRRGKIVISIRGSHM
jgi:hypothetical protein